MTRTSTRVTFAMILVAAVLLASSSIAFAHRAPHTRHLTTGLTTTDVTAPTIAYIGDEITTGYYATDVAHDYVSLVNSGRADWIDSQTNRTAFGLANDWRNNPAPVVASTVQAVVLEVGTWDVTTPTITPSVFSSAYSYLIARIHQDNPTAHIFCLSVWRSPNVTSLNSGYYYNQAIQADCPNYVEISDLYTSFANHSSGVSTEFGTSDWFHPNNNGHAAIAQRLMPYLTTLP